MNTVADDLKRAADWAADCCDRDLARRLRAHAALIEKIEAEMRDYTQFGDYVGDTTASRWADALKTGEMK